MNNHKLSLSTYNFPSWKQKFSDYNVSFNNLLINDTYKGLFDRDDIKKELIEIERYFSHCLKVSEGAVEIYPYPDLVFNALNTTPLNKIKVVILGQDPYIHSKQAMGLSFSVPTGVKIPPSLQNINENLFSFNHIHKKPINGNLSSWAYQGCLLLNTSLTVQEGISNSHESYWSKITNELIKYISDNTTNVVFVLWGGPALKKLDLIDKTKHEVIISSHPSPLSCNNKLRNYDPFVKVDHFKLINEYLEKNKKETIVWQIT